MAGKHGMELLQALRYKLRMMGVPLDGPANCRMDNKSVVTNSTIPESVLKKKCHSIAYHKIRESIASKMAQLAWEPTENNLADCMTKFQPGKKRLTLCEKFMYQ